MANWVTPLMPETRLRRVPHEYQPQPTGPWETCTISRIGPQTTPFAPA